MIVEGKKLQLSKPFVCENGKVLQNPVVAYEEYGKKDGPVIFCGHGGLSSQHAAGKYAESDLRAGSWDDLIGPGKVMDTDKYRIISANALGSCYGTTSAMTVNSDTGKPYMADFPDITFEDEVRFYKQFLEEMGIDHLFMMAGPSMGSLHTLLMAAMYPEFIDCAVAVATAGRMTPSGMAMHHFMMNAIKMDPDFNNGYYDINNPPKLAMRLVHQIARVYFTHEGIMKQTAWDTVPEGPDSQAKRNANCANYMIVDLEENISNKDCNCYNTILTAINGYDLGKGQASYKEGVRRIKCPVLLINTDTDGEFPPHWAYEVASILNETNPGQARVEIMHSPWGHLACVFEGKTITKHIAHFIETI